MAPKKKPTDEAEEKKTEEGKITLPIIGTVSFRTAALILLFFSTDMGQRMLERWGAIANSQSSDLQTIKQDIQVIKKQVAALTTDVHEIKSLADIKKKALDSVAKE